MKSLFIHPNNRITGQELSLFAGIVGLTRLGVDCTVLLPEDGEFSGLLKKEGAALRLFPLRYLSKQNPVPYLQTVWRLFNLLRREKIDIIHCSGIYPHQYALPAARLAGVPCLVRVTTDVYQPYDFKVSFLKYADYVLTCSEAVRRHLINNEQSLERNTKCLYSSIVDRSGCIYDGIIDKDQVRPFPKIDELKQTYGISGDVKVVAQISEVIPRKGLEYFVEMAALVKKEYPAVKFLIVGKAHGDDYEANLRVQIKKLGLEDDVVFTGFRKDLSNFISLLDVSVLASLAEGLARVIVETQYMEKPVVATDVSGNREAITDGVTGFLVPSKDPQALANAVLKILRNPSLAKELGRNGKRGALENFGIDSQAEKIKQIYEMLINKKKGKHV